MKRHQGENTGVSTGSDVHRGIPCERLDPARMRPQDRFDAYFDASATLSDLNVHQPDARDRGIEATSWLLGDLVFMDARVCSHTMRRRKKHLRQAERDLVVLDFGPGTTHILLEDRLAELDAGAFHLTDYSREQIEYCNDEKFSSVFLPYEAVGYNPARHQAHVRIGLETPAGRMLASGFRAIHDQLPHVTLEESHSLAQGFAGLVGGLLFEEERSDVGAAEVSRARGEAMRAYITENLRDPQLDARCLMRVFASSRATVYRAFEDEGGVRDYIYRRRLERGFRELASAAPSRGRVAHIALNLGFSSASHFTRRFQAHFGCLPTSVLGMARRGEWPQITDTGVGGTSGFGKVGRWISHSRA